MTLLKTIISVISVILAANSCYSQYNQIGVLPLGTNPSFAGMANHSRIFTSFAYQTDRSQYYHTNYYASYDNFFQRLGSGIGISIAHTDTPKSSQSDYNSTSISLAIAPKLSLKGKYTISPSIEASGITSRQVFENDLGQNVIQLSGITSRVGILFNSSNYYIGYAVNINHVFYSEYINTYNPRPFIRRAYSRLHIGYSFQKNDNSKFSFTPQLEFHFRSEFLSAKDIMSSMAFNLGFRYDQLLLGILTRGFQIGWQTDALRISVINEFGYHNKQLENYNVNLAIRYIFYKNDHQKFYAF